MSVSPAARRCRISGRSGPNQFRSTEFVALPNRSQTTGAGLSASVASAAKSSSFVTMMYPCWRANSKRARSSRRLRKNYVGTIGIRWFAREHNRKALPQDAQKGCPARPQQAMRRGVPLWYVESLSDARTKLADFFSILLAPSRAARVYGSLRVRARGAKGRGRAAG